MSLKPVLFLDGSLKGKIWSLGPSMVRFEVPVQSRLAFRLWNSPELLWDAAFDTACYRFLPVSLFGRELWLAYEGYLKEQDIQELLWEMLTSSYAQRLNDGIITPS